VAGAEGQAADGGGPPALTGSSARVPAPHGGAAVWVRDPTGARAAWPAAGDAADVPITHVGFYTAGGGAGAAGAGTFATFAANLGDAVESSTAPAPTLTLGGHELPPPDPPAGRPGRPIALLALVAAAALLLFEWWSYHRRWTV
jgi:hypothetical protein